MATPLKRQLDAENRVPLINVAPATAAGHVVVYEQLNAALQGLAWKDDVRFASTTNVDISSPGSSIDGGSLAANDRVLLKDQTLSESNGIYIWNGATIPMTRAPDANTFNKLTAAIVTVSEGVSNGGTSWRQTAPAGGTLDTTAIIWTSFLLSSPAASTTTAGVVRLATQTEVNTGTDAFTVVSPATLAGDINRVKKYSATLGDGAATSISVTHNLNTRNVIVQLYEASGLYRQIETEVQVTTVNSVTCLFDVAPALNSILIVVLA